MRALVSSFPFLLLPFAWLYGGVMRLRNLMYDRQIFSSYQAPIPVICVGNLSVGGTGKTPQVEYLAHLLHPKKIAILSRGYKRLTTGFVLADTTATAQTIGDEPFQYLQNLPQVIVAVCEKREVGIRQLLSLHPELEVILLDDAFQHRAVNASIYLLLTDYSHLFTQDYLLPTGRLREPKAGALRADAVVVTKCPENLSPEKKEAMVRQLKWYTQPFTPIFFSQIVYGAPVPMGPETSLGKRLILVTGIANAQPLVSHVQAEGVEILHHFEGADHTAYVPERVAEIVTFWKKAQGDGISVLMTQKDAVKWQTPVLRAIWQQMPVFYLPITVAFAPQEPTFDESFRNLMEEAGSGNTFYI